MTKHFIKRRPFGRRSSARGPSAAAAPGELSSGFLDRVSCFETLRAYDGRLFCLEEHVARLAGSCRGIGSALPAPRAELARWLKRALMESGWKNAVLRVSVHWDGARTGEIVAILREFAGHAPANYEKGVSLATAVPKRPCARAQDPQIKSSQYLGGVSAFLEKGDTPPYEFALLTQAGYVAEGTVSNIFILREKRLLTPHGSSGILRGVTRGVVIALARKKGLEVLETFLTRHELYNAEECFITNTSSEILPVVSIDGRRVGDGRPGPVTRSLLKAFKELR
jgi:branched-chain amino acid aminotransferase